MKRNSALILAPHFTPGFKAGGVLRSLVNFIDVFESYFTFHVITSDRDLGDENPYFKEDPSMKEYNNCTVYYCGGFFKYLKILRRQITAQYQYVFLNGVFNFRYSLIMVLFKTIFFRHAKIFLFVRGELFDSAMKNKLFLKKTILFLLRFFNCYKRITFVVTDYVELISVNSQIGPHHNLIIFPDLPSFSFHETLLNGNLKRESSNVNFLKLVFVGRIAEIKNLHFLISSLSKVTVNVILEIYGVIDSVDYYNKCLSIVNNLPSNITVVFNGECNHSSLPNIIFNSDMLVLPSLSENFGHVVAESLLLGVPVFVTKNSPWANFLDEQFGLVMDIDSDILQTLEALQGLIESKLMRSKTLDDRIEFSKAAKQKMIQYFKFDELKNKFI